MLLSGDWGRVVDRKGDSLDARAVKRVLWLVLLFVVWLPFATAQAIEVGFTSRTGNAAEPNTEGFVQIYVDDFTVDPQGNCRFVVELRGGFTSGHGIAMPNTDYGVEQARFSVRGSIGGDRSSLMVGDDTKLDVIPIDDFLEEGTETVVLRLKGQDATCDTEGGQKSEPVSVGQNRVSITLADDQDAEPSVAFDDLSDSLTEGKTQAIGFRLDDFQKVQGGECEIEVAVSAEPGTATTDDYALTGTTTATITGRPVAGETVRGSLGELKAVDDTEFENSEGLELSASIDRLGCGDANAPNASKLNGDTANVTINDNDAPEDLSVDPETLQLSQLAGATAEGTVSVSGGTPGYSISAGRGTVGPESLDEAGNVTYTREVPPDANPGEVITYTITVTDSGSNDNQQSKTVSVEITVEAPELEVSPQSLSLRKLPGEQVRGTLTVSGGTPGYTAAADSAEGTVDPPSRDSEGEFTYRFDIPDSATPGAQLSDTVTVTDSGTGPDQQTEVVAVTINVETPPLTPSPGTLELEVLAGGTTQGTLSVSGGIPGYTISVEDGEGSVEPSTLDGPGEVTYKLDVAPDVAANSVIVENIKVTDSQGRETTVEVRVTVDRGLSDLEGLNQAQAAVAGAIDRTCSGLEPQNEEEARFKEQCDALIQEAEGAEQREALSEIAYDDLAARNTQANELSSTQASNVLTRISAVRSGLTDVIALNGLSVDLHGQNLAAGSLADMGLKSALGGAASSDGGVGGSERLGFFVNGRISIGDKDATNREPGFDFDTKGITLGADYRVTDQLVLGGALGYGASDVDTDNDGGKIDTDAVTLSFYGSYYKTQRFYLDWIASYGTTDYESARNIEAIADTPFEEGVAKGETDGDQYGLSLNAGGDFARGPWQLNPFARLEYIRTEMDEMREEGTVWAWEIEDVTVESVKTALGGQVGRPIGLSWGVLTPSVHGEWIHEFEDNEKEISARWVLFPEQDPIGIKTDSPDRDYFNLGASLTATFAGGRSAFFRYETRQGQDDIDAHTFRAGLRFPF